MSQTDPRVATDAIEVAFARRRQAGERLGAAASDIAATCAAMAERFRGSGTLYTFGSGGPSTDAEHVAVEFVHPVIVGKRALPAHSLVSDAATVLGVARRAGLDEVFAHQLSVLARAEDIALGISADGDDHNVLRGLERAHADGLLTVALVGGAGGPIGASPAVDHVLRAHTDDPHVAKEIHVTTYHLLWELVHSFLERPQPAAADADPTGTSDADPQTSDLGGLYPFLYDAPTSLETLVAEVSRSSREKAAEIVALRDEVATVQGHALVAAADDLAGVFADGGKLFACGNGGSSSDAQAVVQCFLDPAARGAVPMPALCLTNDVAIITALSNDVDFEVVFARQVRAFGRPEDAFVGLSTSGNSPNVLRAFEVAKALGMVTIGFAGNHGGAMAASGAIDHLFVVPSASVHRIQETQTTLYHVLHELTQGALST
jgi:D-sedoheptulose 7-phosphate isomerase